MEDSKNNSDKSPPYFDADEKDGRPVAEAELVNTSGHVQEMDRTFGLTSICLMAILCDNAWGAGSGALVVS